MGGASLGCPLAEEKAAEEAEEEGMVPLRQPFWALSLGSNPRQRGAVPERVCAGKGCWASAWLVVWSLGCLGRERVSAVSSPLRPQRWPFLCGAGGPQAQRWCLEGPGSTLLVVPRGVGYGLPLVSSLLPQP